jgi:hypothetical protein
LRWVRSVVVTEPSGFGITVVVDDALGGIGAGAVVVVVVVRLVVVVPESP